MIKLEQIFKAVADSKRIRILKLLENRPMCVCELAFVLGVTQPAISRHLKKLQKAGIIASAQEGFWTNYFLRADTKYAKKILQLMRSWLYDDCLVARDAAKAKKANREKLCCSKNKK